MRQPKVKAAIANNTDDLTTTTTGPGQTEQRLERYRGSDVWPATESLAAMADNQTNALVALKTAIPSLADAATRAAARLANGTGRIIYAGAGASGRLAVQDGVELYPTFSWPKERLVYLLAGGDPALTQSVEGAEDDANEGQAAIETLRLTGDDVVIALAASGSTPFTVAAASAAHAGGALTITMANNPASALLHAGNINILLDTGPEFLAGSTRMTAGTAQKMALNLLSTQIMIGLGRVHDGWMVEVVAANDKLVARSKRILQSLVPMNDDRAEQLWQQSGQDLKRAVLMAEGASLSSAKELLQSCDGRLGLARRAQGGNDNNDR